MNATGESKPVLANAPRVDLPPARWGRAVAIPFMSLATCWAIGATTNAINGVVCIDYFNRLVGWMYGGWMTIGDVVFQGLLEGTGFGIAVAFVLTTAYSVGTGSRCKLGVVWRALFIGAVIAFACWMTGGALGLAWASLSPQSFTSLFPLLHDLPILPRAWVGGSIWGLYPGALAAMITMCVYVVRSYREQVRALHNAPAASVLAG